MKDKILTCQKCKSQFYFTVGEQKFYMEKGLNIPKLCPTCRKNKKENKGNYVPKACSTCYFYRYNSLTIYGECNRINEILDNDAPCKHWTRKK